MHILAADRDNQCTHQFCDSRASETSTYGPISSDAANNDACSASICYTHGADRCDLYFCRSSVDDSMPRTAAHHSLLHLIVHTDFMTDIPWNNSLDIISGWCIMLCTLFPVWHPDVHSIIAYAFECLMH